MQKTSERSRAADCCHGRDSCFSSADSSNGHLRSARPRSNRADARPVIIFDCNGVLVDSEEIAAAVLAEELTRAGIAITPQPVMHHLSGRRPAEMFATIEAGKSAVVALRG